MPLSFADAQGNLFNRIGKLGLLVKQQRTYQTAQLANMTDTANGVVSEFNAESDIQAIMGSAYIGLLDDGATSLGSTAQAIAAATVNRMVFRDNPQINQTLTGANTVASIQEVIRQMNVAGARVFRTAVSSAVTQFGATVTNTGNAVVTASVIRPLDGLTLENAFDEDLKVVCTADSYTGGAVEDNETLTITGTGSQDNVFAFNWPLGSNATVTVNAIDGNTSAGSGNLLTNSGFDTYVTTANVPDNWSLVVGTAGTNLFQDTGVTYDGASALRVTGDGTTLIRFRQLFGDSTGTSEDLDPQTQYSFNVWVRRDAVAAAGGVMRVELTDVNGVVMNDENGAANAFDINLTALTTVYAPYSGVFRTPVVMPSAVYIQFRMTTGNALSSGRSVYFDKAGLGIMTQVYTSGPYVAVHAGSAPLVTNDLATVAITNSRGSGGTLDTFQTLFARLFPEMLSSELLLPSSDVPNISDTDLIAF